MALLSALIVLTQGANAAASVHTSAAQIARAALQVDDSASVETALRSVEVCEATAAATAVASLGVHRTLDLHLLAGGPEAQELMDTLRAAGELSLGDRAKIRLLVGDREHIARVSANGHAASPRLIHYRRQVQDSDETGQTLSVDTIAIVFSVLVGVAGYMVQAWTSGRAQRHAAFLQQEQDAQARLLQREHEKTQAQIRRIERWVDDCIVPAHQALVTYLRSRIRFVGAFAGRLEASQPQSFAEMYKSGGFSMKYLTDDEDGLIWRGAYLSDGKKPHVQTWTVPTTMMSIFGDLSSLAADITLQDMLALYNGPYMREAPQVTHSDRRRHRASASRLTFLPSRLIGLLRCDHCRFGRNTCP
eukprot:SAG31_NODE_4164_length_3518_cov_6.234864_4_plen_361_part_00